MFSYNTLFVFFYIFNFKKLNPKRKLRTVFSNKYNVTSLVTPPFLIVVLPDLKEDLKNYKCLIEKVLLLVWRHIEFYFMAFQTQGNSSSSDERGFKQDRITFEDFQKFKQNLNCALNPNLLKRLVDIENRSAEKTGDFVQILVKRSQRLLHLTSS